MIGKCRKVQLAGIVATVHIEPCSRPGAVLTPQVMYFWDVFTPASHQGEEALRGCGAEVAAMTSAAWLRCSVALLQQVGQVRETQKEL